MRERTAFRIRSIVAVTAMSSVLGIWLGSRFEPTATAMLTGSITGALIGGTITCGEIVLLQRGEALRRLPVLLALALRSAAYLAVFFAAVAIAVVTVRLIGPGGAPVQAPAFTPSNFAISVSVAVAVNLFFTLRALLGAPTLTALLTGRYHQPRQEDRIVLFMDLRGSTTLAERLGDLDFHRFLNRVAFDVTDPVLESGGEIYRYVGDEIIVTWKLATGARDGAAVACIFAIAEALERRRGDYLGAFGAVPELRAALHAGRLIVGEMGDVKREIVMLGDTMNTTARIEQACRDLGRDIIASGAALRAVTALPPGVAAESLGPVALRGKEGEVELFALARRSP